MAFLFSALLFLGFTGCGAETTKVVKHPKKTTEGNTAMEIDTATMEVDELIDLVIEDTFPYQLESPRTTFKLPNKLKEISGLGIDAEGKYLYAVQDEEGKLFMINTTTGEVEKDKKFHKSGDYEGVEFVNDRAFVIKSSGTLYEVLNLGEDNQELIKHKFSFNKSSDVEGLGYDSKNNRLLISCKGMAGNIEDNQFKKCIFGFDLDSMKMEEKPVFTISVTAIKEFLQTNHTLKKFDKLIKLFKPGEEFIFGPSGLAVHPKTGDIYIISSVGKLLVVLDSVGEIKHLVKLKKKIHPQPEGIVFDQQGTMYIANEGKEGKGRVHVFEYRE